MKRASQQNSGNKRGSKSKSKCTHGLTKYLKKLDPEEEKEIAEMSLFDAIADRSSSIDLMRTIALYHPERLRCRNKEGLLPLHVVLLERSDLFTDDFSISCFIMPYPESLQVKDHLGRLPLHLAVWKNLPWGIISYFLIFNSEGVREKDNRGQIPLHYALSALFNFNRSFYTVRSLVKQFPGGLRERDQDGRLPLHLVAGNARASSDLIRFVAEEFPGGLREQDQDGRLPIHLVAGNKHATSDLIRFVAEEFPEGLRTKDLAGSLPLHCAIISRSYSWMVNSRFLIEQYPQSLQEKDNRGLLPVVSIAMRAMEKDYHYEERGEKIAKLELIYFCVLRYPNFLFDLHLPPVHHLSDGEDDEW